jgi:pyrimidine deaminase RibD-like protein
MVGACVLDPDNNIVARLNYLESNGKRVHAERAAVEAYENKYGDVPEGSIVITTLSPCNETDDVTADGRVGESCAEYLNSKGIEKVYCGYIDPTQDNDIRNFNLMETSDKSIREECKKFADTFLKQDIHEGYSNTTFQTKRRRLNVPALIKAGALFVTYPHGEQGWETDNQEDWAYSLISLYNVMQGGWSSEAKKYLKPASYKKAEQQVNSSAPNLGSDKLVYDGKYNQILWSIKKLGIPDNVAFLDDSTQSGEQEISEASGYIPSEKEKNDPRFKTALTVDVKPDSIKKNAKAFSWLTSRAGIPPTLNPSGKF